MLEKSRFSIFEYVLTSTHFLNSDGTCPILDCTLYVGVHYKVGPDCWYMCHAQCFNFLQTLAFSFISLREKRYKRAPPTISISESRSLAAPIGIRYHFLFFFVFRTFRFSFVCPLFMAAFVLIFQSRICMVVWLVAFIHCHCYSSNLHVVLYFVILSHSCYYYYSC